MDGLRSVYSRSSRRRVASTVDLRLLGPVELRLGDGPVELGPRKQRAVLAMLALAPGAPSRRTISRGSLGRRAAGERAEDDPALRLAPATGDRWRRRSNRHPRARLRAADERRRGGRGPLRAPAGGLRPREALALWHGEALADLADEPFAAVEIRRLDDLRLRAAETAIDADLEAGRHAEVIGELNALVAEQPLREHLHAPADARAVPRRPPV